MAAACNTTLPYSYSSEQNCVWVLQCPTAPTITLPAKESPVLKRMSLQS